jgi:hypothetical protein
MRNARPITAPSPRASRRFAARRDDGASPALVQSLAHLRSAITHHVGRRRAEGAALHEVLAEVSALVGRAELLEGWSDELGLLLGQVWRWTLDAYPDEPELPNAPRFS